MELMKQVLQDYCNQKGHDLEEAVCGYRIYFYQGFATQVDVFFLVECANKYGWNFYIASASADATYAIVYEASKPLAA